MAFVPPTRWFRSSFLFEHRACDSTCPNQPQPPCIQMKIGDLAANGLKIAFVTGAVAATLATAFPTDADAAIFHIRGERPETLGVRYGRYLDNCPPTPNCISSSANVVRFPKIASGLPRHPSTHTHTLTLPDLPWSRPV